METFLYIVIVMAASFIAMKVSSSNKPVHPVAYFIGNAFEFIFIVAFLIYSIHHHEENLVLSFYLVFYTALIAFAWWYQCCMLARRIIIKDKVYEMKVENCEDGAICGFIHEGLFKMPVVMYIDEHDHFKTGDVIKVKYHGCYEGETKCICHYDDKGRCKEKKFIYFTVARCD